MAAQSQSALESADGTVFEGAGPVAGEQPLGSRKWRRFFTGALRAALAAVLLSCSAYTGATRLLAENDSAYLKSAAFTSGRLHANLYRRQTEELGNPWKRQAPLEQYRANWLYVLRYGGPIEITDRADTMRFHVDELLFDMYHPRRDAFYSWILPWRLLQVHHYDQLQTPILDVLLDVQFETCREYLDSDRWPGMGVGEWDSLPVPVRKAAAYQMVWEWTRRRDPARYGLSQPEAGRVLASIGLVESLFDLDKIRNFNDETGNEDRGYMQISDAVRLELAREPEFRRYQAEDYYTPWVSIQAASYLLFDKLMKYSEGDVGGAIRMYNAGRSGSEERADRYLSIVLRKYHETFHQQYRYSPTRYRIITRATPRYFDSVRQDRLFHLSRRSVSQ